MKLARCLSGLLVFTLLPVMLCIAPAYAQIAGDINQDGLVDRRDVDLLLLNRNSTVEESSCGAPCDLDGDSRITALDARQLVLLCTNPGCAGPAMALVSRPRANPSSGPAPLTVNFIPEYDTDTAVELFEWDFDGDGNFDRSETVGINQTFVYTTAGTFTVTLRITDSNGVQASGTVTVNVVNAPPEVTADAIPSNGEVPLTVTFTATATDNEGIASYEWDFDGDGNFDFSSTTTGAATFDYMQPGTFQAVVRVTDTLGASTTLSLPTTEVRPGPQGSPSVTVTANPVTGKVPLTVNFNANATAPGGLTFTDYDWDFDGDGTFDQNQGSPQTNFTYTAPGTFFARVRVTASDGGMVEDVVQVTVAPDASLSISIDTIDPDMGETTTVQTVLGGDTRVSLIIEDRNGMVVRTLVPFTDRQADTYQDVWDGRDDNGMIVANGDYYAVLLAEVNGEVQRFDLRETTGGNQSSPQRSPLPPRFAPFANDPLIITFSLPRAAEVTAFIGRFNVNTRLVTFFERKPLGRGSHTVVWNGENGNGQLIHPPAGDSFLFGIFSFTLADNAVFVNSLAQVSSLSAMPSIFTPSNEQPGTLTFDLSKAADVELFVSDAETGGEMGRFRYPGLDAGTNTITWDGKTADDVFVAPGRYRLGITAIDASGSRSITLYTLQRIYY